MTFNNSTAALVTITLLDNLILTGGITLSYNNTYSVFAINGNTISVSGPININAYSAGTTNFIIANTGNSTISNSNGLSHSVTVNAGICTVYWDTWWCQYGGSFTYTSGVCTFSSMKSFWFFIGVNGVPNTTLTLNCSGMVWPNVQIFPYTTATLAGYTQVITLNQQLNINGALFLMQGTNITFNGTSGFSVGRVSIWIDPGGYMALTPGILYKSGVEFASKPPYDSAFDAAYGTPSNKTIVRSTNTTKATLLIGNSENNPILATNLNVQYIDCSGGGTLAIWNGTYSNCTNVTTYLDLAIVTGS